MTNIAEILEFAPEGLKLYSTVHGEVKLKGITKLEDYPIELETIVSGDEEYYDCYGKMFQEYGECILFPSKDYYDWDDWQKILFPQCVGSVIYCPSFGENGKYLLITEKCAVSTKGKGFYDEYELFTLDNGDERFATPEETEKFWEELDANGYVFDGMRVVKKEWSIYDANDGDFVYDSYNETVFIFKEVNSKKALIEYVSYPSLLDFHTQIKSNGIQHSTLGNYYDKKQYRLATTKELQFLLSKLNDAGYYWNSTDRKIISGISREPEKTEEKFTIEDFKPFDKVLVRDSSEECWNISMFSFTTGNTRYPYQCLQYTYSQCIPYNEETVYLLGTTKKYDGKYKTWKD